MNEVLDNTDRLTCSEAALLLEQRFAEEPLSSQAEQRLTAHLAACRKCRRSEDWISALCVHADAHAEKRFFTGLGSAFQALVDKRARGRHKENRIKAAVAIGAAAILFSFIFLQDRPAPLSSPRVDAATVSIDCAPAPLREPVPGVWMTSCVDETLDARIENDGEVRVRLEGGTVGMRIDPNRPHKKTVTVEIPQGEIRVRGTMFTVHVDTQKSQVEVFRGVVEFIPTASAENALSLKAGQGADLRHQTVFALSSSKINPIRQLLSERGGRQATNPSPSPPGEVTSSKLREAMVAVDNHGPTESTDAPDDRRESVTQRSGTGMRSSSPPKHDVPSIDRLIHEAQSCLIARNWACASARYEGLLTHYPNSPESTSALISLARIELRHLGRPAQALAHLRAYQRRAPDGPMAEEALFGIAVTLRRLGKRDQEHATLRQFVEQYPGSSQIRRARTRLRHLESDE